MKKILLILSIAIASLFASPAVIMQLDINGMIGPASYINITKGIKTATKQNDTLLLIKIHTERGLESSMRKIIYNIKHAKIPIIMYIQPVSKNFSYISNINTIDFNTNSTQELLSQLNGKSVTIAGKQFNFQTKNVILIKYKSGIKTKFLRIITDPNIIYILLLIAIYGVFFELINPGGIIPGVTGLISAAIVFYALTLLPFDYLGLILIIFGIGLIIAEIFVSAFGILGLGGVVSFAFGSFLLFNADTVGSSVSIPLIVAFTVVNIAFFIMTIKLLLRSRSQKIITGKEDMIGSKAEVVDAKKQNHHVLYKGEIWNATSQNDLRPKQQVKIVGIDGLVLKVKPIE